MMLRLVLLAVAGLGPLAFPLASAGHAPLHQLALVLIVPSAALLAAAVPLLRRWRPALAAQLWRGLLAGAAATLALEAIRYPAFRLGFMPGNMPQLMGVLLLNRFALGPSAWSNAAGFAYHFWNGAAFGAILAVVAGRRAPRLAVPYALVIGIGFLGSPVVASLGGGTFGLGLGWAFIGTVLTAHVAFGAALGGLLKALGADAARTTAD